LLRIVTKLKIRNLRLKHIALREQAPGVGQTGAFASSLSFGNLAASADGTQREAKGESRGGWPIRCQNSPDL